MGKKVLAFDFGGSSGRALLGELQNGKLNYKEIHRFQNLPKHIDGHFCWDFDNLYNNVLEGISIAAKEGFDSIGIDTWGVDYGIISSVGLLLKPPIHYRDERTQGALEMVDDIISRDELYRMTGIQPMRINTIYQLFSEFSPYFTGEKKGINENKESCGNLGKSCSCKCKCGTDASPKEDKSRKELLANTDKILFMPDLFAYMLCGEMASERSIASTSALYDANKNDWDKTLIKKLGLDEKIFPKIISSGKSYGLLKAEIANKYGIKQVPIIAVPAHDTASAIMSVPTYEDSIYISCGTWSLMGVKREGTEISDKGFTNEYGFSYVTYLKNIMGLWLMQETNRTLKEQGIESNFKILDEYMAKSKSCGSVVDPSASDFELQCDMPEAIKNYCKKTGQAVPKDIGEVVHCIYESLAVSYKYTHKRLEEIFKKKYNQINIIGGGSKADVLCQMTSDYTGCKVVAGPVEATAIGNMLAQLIGLGEVKNLKEGTDIVIKGENIKEFFPNKNVDCRGQFKKYLQLVGEKE